MSLGQPCEVQGRLWVTKMAAGAWKFLEGLCGIQTHPEGECDPRQEPDLVSLDGWSCRETFGGGPEVIRSPRDSVEPLRRRSHEAEAGMGNAEVRVMFGGGGIAAFNREGREARPPGLPACSLLASLAHTIHVALLLSLLCPLALSQNC